MKTRYDRAMRLVILLSAAVSICTKADTSSPSLNINISGTVVANACTVNDGNPVTVEFGAVPVNQIDVTSQDVQLNLTCDTPPTGTVSMEINGTASAFDTRALATDVDGLGIILGSKGSTQYGVLDLNTFYEVDKTFGLTAKTGTFTLHASLTSDGKNQFTGGEFNASATLVIQVS